MLENYKKEANKWLVSGFLVWFVGNILRGTTQAQNPQYFLGYGLFITGFGLFIYGCVNYVKAKGWHWAFGLLGVFSLLGLLILYFLPDKNKAKV
jgi:dipeptide/tripeptide permease